MSKKKNFDPNNQNDLVEFKFFLENNKWKDVCPFFLEWPHLTVPDMIKEKIVRNLLNVKVA